MRLLVPIVALLVLAGCEWRPGVREAEDAVRRQLKDPDSAQFRDVRPCAPPDAVEGEVNSKNSYGGYAGFEPFIYARGEAAIGYGAEDFGRLQRLCYPLDLVANMANDSDVVDTMPVDNLR